MLFAELRSNCPAGLFFAINHLGGFPGAIRLFKIGLRCREFHRSSISERRIGRHFHRQLAQHEVPMRDSSGTIRRQCRIRQNVQPDSRDVLNVRLTSNRVRGTFGVVSANKHGSIGLGLKHETRIAAVAWLHHRM